MKKETIESKLHSIRGELQTLVGFMSFIEKEFLPDKPRTLYKPALESLENIEKHLDDIGNLILFDHEYR
jgi:hypothetical protein